MESHPQQTSMESNNLAPTAKKDKAGPINPAAADHIADLTADQIAVDPSLSDATADPTESQSRSEWLLGTAVMVFGVVWLTPDALLIKLAHSSGTCILFYRMLYFFWATIFASLCWALIQTGSFWAGIHLLWQAFTDMGWPCPALSVCAVYCPTISCFVLALDMTSAANCMVLVGTSPLWSALFSVTVLDESLRWHTGVAILLAVGCVAGMFVFGDSSTDDDTSWEGDLLALCCAVGLAAYFVAVRRGRDQNHGHSFLPLLPLNCLVTAAAAICLGADPFQPSGLDHLWFFLQGAIVAPIAIGALTVGPAMISAPECSLIQLLEMVLSPLLVWCVLDEVPAIATCIAGGVLLLVMVLHSVLALREALASQGDSADAKADQPSAEESLERNEVNITPGIHCSNACDGEAF